MNNSPFWKKSIRMVLKKITSKYKDVPDKGYDIIIKAFNKKDGSWERLASGNPEDWLLLRDMCKSYLKVSKKRNLPPFGEKNES